MYYVSQKDGTDALTIYLSIYLSTYLPIPTHLIIYYVVHVSIYASMHASLLDLVGGIRGADALTPRGPVVAPRLVGAHIILWQHTQSQQGAEARFTV